MENLKKLSKAEMKNVNGGDGYAQCAQACDGIIPWYYDFDTQQVSGGGMAPSCDPGSGGCFLCDKRFATTPDGPGSCIQQTWY